MKTNIIIPQANDLLHFSMARSLGRLAFLLLGAVLASFGLLRAQAEDGGYPNGNTVEGDFAMYYFVTNATSGGFSNTAIAHGALELDSDGWENTATGSGALASNRTGWDNTAIGVVALQGNSTGNYNTAIGAAVLENNNADNNTATGFGALRYNTTASGNTADGYEALYSNTVGYENTATGFQALYRTLAAVIHRVALIRLTVGADSIATPAATVTRASVPVRFITTTLAMTIRPMVV